MSFTLALSLSVALADIALTESAKQERFCVESCFKGANGTPLE